MKIKSLLIVLSLFTILISCKNDKSVDSIEVVQQEEIEKGFKVSIDVIAKVDDDFALYYTEDGSVNFFEGATVWQNIKGNENSQRITFSLPEDIYPTQLRLDFGMKQEQPDVILNKLTLSYEGKIFEANGIEIFKFFRADENQCSVDSSTGVIKAKIKDGKRLTPSLYPHQLELGVEIEKLAN